MEELLPDSVNEDGIETIRVETALSRFPIHALSGGEVKIQLQNIGTATKWNVNYNSGFGQPGQLAYKIDTLVINRRIEEAERPIPKIVRLGSLREIASEINQGDGEGAKTNLIKQALLQNASAFITAKIKYKTKEGSERDLEFGDTRYAVVFTGEKLPDGRKADSVYIVLHDFYREILNFAVARPLDYAYMKALPPMAQRFYEIISYVIYAALYHRNKSCKMRYSEFCKLSTATRYFTFDQVKKQMYKIHKPHVESGYIERGITYQATTDEEGKADWWMFYVPGPNAGRQYAEFTAIPRKRVGATELPNSQPLLPFIEEVPAIPPRTTGPARSEEPIPSPEVQALMEELIEAGVSKGEALTMATLYPDESRKQLKYLPYAEIRSTPGAYLASAIKSAYGPPKAFLEAETKRQEEERRKKAQEAQAARERAAAIRRQAEVAFLDSEIATLEVEEPERYADFLGYIEAQKSAALNKPFLKAGSRAAEIMAQNFETPERRRELFTQWQAQERS